MFARQLQHELVRMFARRRTYIGFAAFVVLEVVLMIMFNLPRTEQLVERMLVRNGFDLQTYFGGLTLALFTVAMTFGVLGTLYVALVAGDIVAKEVEEGTMRLVLARPVSRFRVAGLKWGASLIYTAILMAFIGASALIAGLITRGYLGSMFFLNAETGEFLFVRDENAVLRYALTIVAMTFVASLIASAAFMFSCFRMKPAAATILTLSIIIADSVLYNIPFFADYRGYMVTYHLGFYIRSLQDNPPWPGIIQSIIYLSALNLSCFVVGATRFITRDLKA